MSKIVYNKERSGKIIARGGPRDIQNRQKLLRQSESLKESFVEDMPKDKTVYGDLSQYMLLSDVKTKILEAVGFAKKEESAKFEHEIELLHESVDSKSLMYDSIIKDKDNQISELKNTINILSNTIEKGFARISDLQSKLDLVYDKIANGSIEPLVGSHMDRPILEDSIFIDPIDTRREKQMDSHIEIEEEKPIEENKDKDKDKDISAQAAKLRALLNK
jgi:hypothetical protein